MVRKLSSPVLFEILLFTLSSLLLYHAVVGGPLFLIPLQIVASRRRFSGLVLAEGVFLAAFLAIRLWPTPADSAGALTQVTLVLEIGVVTLCLLGLLIVNLPLRRRPRILVMLLAATGVAGAVAVPAALVAAHTPGFNQAMDEIFTRVSQMMSHLLAPSPDSPGATIFSQMLQPANLRQMTEATVVRSFLVDYLALLSFSWWAGQAAARRGPALRAAGGFRLSAFRLESGWLWPLIVSGALVLADLFFGQSPSFAFFNAAGGPVIAWNAGLIMLFLFGLQGMAIVMFLFEKYHFPRLLWVLLVVSLVVMAGSPGPGVFVVLVVPALGISENWVRYRIPPEAAPAE